MDRWIRRVIGFSVFAVCLTLGVSQACAVALGKIEVTSHLGEAFFAEIPMQLGKNETISSVSAGLATPAEYRLLEIYRDPVLNAIRSEVKNDSRGVRVELSSHAVIDAPFFNLILKIRYGHATQFKKYPVFLDLPQGKPVQTGMPPEVSVVNSQVNTGKGVQPEASGVAAQPAAEAGSAKPVSKLYSGWARTGRYGPMVYGDTIRTVALRLRADARYTLPQVMMALFNKNRKKFSRGNVNLINAGTWLNVPTASEVEEMTPSEASKLLAKQTRAWNALKKQPRYTAIAEAQKNRYKARVSVGNMAIGTASASAPGLVTSGRTGTKMEGGQSSKAEPSVTTGTAETTVANSAQQEKSDALRQGNTALQEKLKVADDKIEVLSDKLSSADVVAANARIRKLELSLARLQANLDRSRQEAKSRGATPIQWLTYLLGGLVALLLGVVGMLLTRERPHPAVASASANVATVAPPSGREVEEKEVSAATESDQAATRMDAREPGSAPADHAPNLMKSDTAEGGAFQEEFEDTLDPNVDYMAEADIYLRYGMEDEAIDQIKMAIKQYPDHAGAYIALIRALQSKGDQGAMDAAIEAGRGALNGEELQAFEVVVSPRDGGEFGVDPTGTAPSMDIGALAPSETGRVAAEIPGESEQNVLVAGQEIDMAEVESPDVEAKAPFESSLPEMIDFDLNIQPVADGKSEDEMASDEGGDGAMSLDIETSRQGHADESGEMLNAGLEFVGSDESIDMPDRGVAPDSLHVDKARSLLAEGALDEAESSFKAAMDADSTREGALIGLADVAWHRGDATKASEFLAETEALVDGDNRDWFESVKGKIESAK